MEFADLLFVEYRRIEALPEIVQPLLRWFGSNARQMPWRSKPQPYYVWVSEIMLQQTRVEAVRSYFDRFLKEIPTIETLAAAPEEKLLKLWEGLGYYNRVRNLQKAARQVITAFGGELPADYDALRSLCGIGDYTAGAIASIAFQIAVPAVDGNVYRVLSRVLGSSANVDDTAVKQTYRHLVMTMIPAEKPGDFNQSLMELGAMVCRPNGFPHCDRCPLQTLCASCKKDWVQDLPVKNPPATRKKEARMILILAADNKILLSRRPPTGLLANFWQPLNLKGHYKLPEIQKYLEELGITLQQSTKLPPATHIFSHIEWSMEAWLLTCEAADAPEGCAWVTDFAEYPLPSAFSAYRPTMEEQMKSGSK